MNYVLWIYYYTKRSNGGSNVNEAKIIYYVWTFWKWKVQYCKRFSYQT